MESIALVTLEAVVTPTVFSTLVQSNIAQSKCSRHDLGPGRFRDCRNQVSDLGIR